MDKLKQFSVQCALAEQAFEKFPNYAEIGGDPKLAILRTDVEHALYLVQRIREGIKKRINER